MRLGNPRLCAAGVLPAESETNPAVGILPLKEKDADLDHLDDSETISGSGPGPDRFDGGARKNV